MGLKIWNASGVLSLDTSTDIVPSVYAKGVITKTQNSLGYLYVLCADPSNKILLTTFTATTTQPYYTPYFDSKGLQYEKLADRFKIPVDWFYAYALVINYRIITV
jgi:hypothetical protein